MNERKILLLTPDFPPNEGGVARYLRSLAEYFRDDIEVVCAIDDRWQSYDPTAGYPIFRRPLLSSWGFARWRKSVSFLRAFADRYRVVVVSHVIPFGTAAWVARWFTKMPYVVIVHGMDVRLAARSSRKKWIANRVLAGARTVVANSSALSREVATAFGLSEVLVAYPCVPDSVAEASIHDPARSRLLTISRLVERKGHACVLNALALLKTSGHLGGIVYDIAGEGPLEQTLRSMAEELGLEACVTFHGSVNDEKREALYQVADLFVMPVSQGSVDKEGFGLVYIEAARHGVPSISTRVSGVDEAVIDGETGVLLHAQDPQELAQKILELTQDSSLRLRLGQAASAHAKRFTCNKQFEKLRPFL